MERVIYWSEEFEEFFKDTSDRIREKIEYISNILIGQNVINSEIAKKLTNTDFYEVRIRVGNEYRIITFVIDNEDINQSTQILFLNAFQKKDTKDYNKQIKKAIKILEKWEEK